MKTWIGVLLVCVGLGGPLAAQSTATGSPFSLTRVRNSAAIFIGDHPRAALGGVEIVNSHFRGSLDVRTNVRNRADIVIGDHSRAALSGVPVRWWRRASRARPRPVRRSR